MTMSPAYGNHEMDAPAVEITTKFYDHGNGLILKKLDPKNHKELLELVQKRKMSTRKTLRADTAFLIIPGITVNTLLHTRQGIWCVTSAGMTSVVIYSRCCIIIETNSMRRAIYVQSRQNVSIAFGKDVMKTTASIRFCPAVSAHSPIETSIRSAACKLQPGTSLWYATTHATTPRHQHVVFFQCNMTKCIICTKCGKYFSTLGEWQEHYETPFILPGKFARARFDDGRVIVCNDKLSLTPPADPGIEYFIKNHGYSFKSLGDKVYGKKLSHLLHQKLVQLRN